MVGKWYKYIGKKSEFFITNKWYKCIGNLKTINAFLDENSEPNGAHPENHIDFDLSNQMDYNPDEVKKEPKPQLEVYDSITIEISSEGKVNIKSTLNRFETVYLLKKVTESEIDKINEKT